MKITVCGDSFCSADTGRPGSHFSELLQQAGHTVINLARGGTSNIGIAFQLQESFGRRPDLVIFNTTGPRLNLPTGKKKFQSELGLKNFCYPYKADASSSLPCVGGADAPVWSDVPQAMIYPRPDLPAELHLSFAQQDAVQKYLAYLHEPDLQSVTDNWIIGYWKYQLQAHDINFLQLTRVGIGAHMYEYVKQYPELANQAVYHTDFQTQQRISEEILQSFV
jgi:hypothetical protein